jgi:TPP-dependent pyruvate/acetoin dehydrogenase alpha subunit
MHDAMNAISVWKLPTIVMVTDNRVAISTLPEEGRGIVDFEAYARGFGLAHFACDGPSSSGGAWSTSATSRGSTGTARPRT